MNKKIIFLTVAATILNAGNLLAGTTHLSEYKWGAPRATDRNSELPVSMMYGNSEGGNYCMQNCPGYSMTVTECSVGYELKSCEASNCSEYHKCEATGCAPGYDTNLKDCPIDVQEDNYMCSKCIE